MPRSHLHPSPSTATTTTSDDAIPLRAFRPESDRSKLTHTSVLFDAAGDDDGYITDEEDEGMGYSNRPGLVSRPSEQGRSAEPLLNGPAERGRTSYDAEGRVRDMGRSRSGRRRYRLRSRSPLSGVEAKIAGRRKYALAAVFLVLSLVSFVIQTETAVYIQSTLHWRKAYLMLYLTHGSWILLFPTQLILLKLLTARHTPWSAFLHSHLSSLLLTARMIHHQTAHLSRSQSRTNPLPRLFKNLLFITTSLTIAGSTWYIAVNLTTPSDLTAIYNCSAFFAYVFSIFLLGEKLRRDKILSVAVAIAGVLIVAYGDTTPDASVGAGAEEGETEVATNRTLGNITIGIGSILYGFYEVLYKRLACPPTSPSISSSRSVQFANLIGSMLGLITLTILWIPIPILHYMGWEEFELPRGEAAKWMAVSVGSNCVFSGSFLVLISLTSPVLSSVAALLTIFLVAIVDWGITGKPVSGAGLVGGLVIIGAFFGLAWATYREMQEEAEHRGKEADDVVDPEDWEEDEDEDEDEER